MKPIHRKDDDDPNGVVIKKMDQEMERLHKNLLWSCSGRGKSPEEILRNISDLLGVASLGDIAMRERENLPEEMKQEAVNACGVAERGLIIIEQYQKDMTWILLLARNVRAMCEHAELSPGKKYIGIEGLDEAITWSIHGMELELPSQRKEVV